MGERTLAGRIHEKKAEQAFAAAVAQGDLRYFLDFFDDNEFPDLIPLTIGVPTGPAPSSGSGGSGSGSGTIQGGSPVGQTSGEETPVEIVQGVIDAIFGGGEQSGSGIGPDVKTLQDD